MRSTTAPPAADRRLWEIDALRGPMLLLMTATHIPTRWSDPLGQPFGFVSAAEGFVLLSGFMAGTVYARKQLRAGDDAMRDAGALWLAAQFGAGRALYDAVVASAGLPVPRTQSGAFEWLAWQFLWIIGLWIGAERAAGRPVQPVPFESWAVAAAVVIALVHLVWRQAVGQAPFGTGESLNLLYDKWRLGPLRLIGLFALIVVTWHFGGRWARRAPRPRALELLGRQSLPVFCAHVLLAALVLALLGPIDAQRPWLIDSALLSACVAILFAVALSCERADREAARAKQRLKALRDRRRGAKGPARPPPAATADAPQSPAAKAHNPCG